MKKIYIFFIFGLFLISGPVFAGDIQTAGHIQTGTMYYYDIPVSVDNTSGFGCINDGYYLDSVGGTVCSNGAITPLGVRSLFTLDAWITSATLNVPYTFIMNDGTDNYFFTVFKRGTNNWSLGTTGYSPLPVIQGNDCSTYDIGCYIITGFQYLFSPSQASLDNFTSLYTLFKTKPPFGYLFAINNIVSGVNITEASAFTLESVPVLNTYIFDPIRTGLAMVLWVFFVFILYSRFKHIQL
jgi:hypothetical protein